MFINIIVHSSAVGEANTFYFSYIFAVTLTDLKHFSVQKERYDYLSATGLIATTRLRECLVLVVQPATSAPTCARSSTVHDYCSKPFAYRGCDHVCFQPCGKHVDCRSLWDHFFFSKACKCVSMPFSLCIMSTQHNIASDLV